jgi:hypothetical protein
LKAAIAITLGTLVLTTANAKAATKAQISKIDRNIASIWHMQRVMHTPLVPTKRTYKTTPSERYFKWVDKLWRNRYQRISSAFRQVPNKSAWLCIHSYEGSWTDSGAPFWGGLQMDWSFQATYGPYLFRLKGTADHWTPTEQMWVAEHARASGRGFYPWPNTARYCGLI